MASQRIWDREQTSGSGMEKMTRWNCDDVVDVPYMHGQDGTRYIRFFRSRTSWVCKLSDEMMDEVVYEGGGVIKQVKSAPMHR